MIDQHGSNTTFTFSHVAMNAVLKELTSINIRKTAGCDLIPGKLIKEGADFLCKAGSPRVFKSLKHDIHKKSLKIRTSCHNLY